MARRLPRRQLELIHDLLTCALFCVLFVGGMEAGVSFTVALSSSGLATVGFLLFGLNLTTD